MSAPFLSGGPLSCIYVPILLVRFVPFRIEQIQCPKAYRRKAEARSWIRNEMKKAYQRGGIEAWTDIITIRREIFEDGSDEGT